MVHEYSDYSLTEPTEADF